RVGLPVGILLDVMVQYMLFRSVRIVGAMIVGTLLIAVPYVMARGLANRVVSRPGPSVAEGVHSRRRRGWESAGAPSPSGIQGGSTMSGRSEPGEGKILTALVFPDKYRASEAKLVLMRLADEGKIQIHDSAVVVRYEDGKVRLHTETDPAREGRTD